MTYKDSVGNTYDKLPTRPPNHTAKAAKPGPKHGRKSNYKGPKKKHGIESNKPSWLDRWLAKENIKLEL
jgi:hypothetical protein